MADSEAKDPSKAESAKTIAGLLAVSIGTVVVGLIAGGAIVVNSSTSATIASSTAGVIGSIVGAYFGVKVGTDQSKKAIDGQRQEAARAQVFAAHLPSDKAETVLGLADRAAKNVSPE